MGKEIVRELNANENDALYWSLKFASENPAIVGLDEEEVKSVNELFELFRMGHYRISENTSVIK